MLVVTWSMFVPKAETPAFATTGLSISWDNQKCSSSTCTCWIWLLTSTWSSRVLKFLQHPQHMIDDLILAALLFSAPLIALFLIFSYKTLFLSKDWKPLACHFLGRSIKPRFSTACFCIPFPLLSYKPTIPRYFSWPCFGFIARLLHSLLIFGESTKSLLKCGCQEHVLSFMCTVYNVMKEEVKYSWT